jgi:flagellar FliL protein
MASNPSEMAPEANEAPAGKGDGATPEESAQVKGGGISAWIPLIVTVVTMPMLAYATTTFVLLPKVQKTLAASETAAADKHDVESGKPKEQPAARASTEAPHASKEKGGQDTKVAVPISKILVNLSGSMGTRYLLTSLSLVGDSPSFKDQVDKNQAQLVDLAAGILGSKTIADLEKPGARNIVRNELLTVFNNALGEGSVKELYITEFAVQ